MMIGREDINLMISYDKRKIFLSRERERESLKVHPQVLSSLSLIKFVKINSFNN